MFSGLLDSYSSHKNETPIKESPIVKENIIVVEAKTETPKPIIASVNNNERIFISPLAKILAEEKGINISQLQGSGENGRIIKRDIENYQPIASNVSSYIPAGEEAFEEVKNSQMRKVIAKRLGESKFMAPHYYLTVELDMDNANFSKNSNQF